MATLAPQSRRLPDPDFTGRLPYDQQPDVVELARLQAISDNLDLDAGDIVGGIVRWQRGDGYALYLVTKERPLTLQHLDFGDGWAVEPALIRGLNKQDVLTMLHREQRLRALFTKDAG